MAYKVIESRGPMVRTRMFSSGDFERALEYYNDAFGFNLPGEGVGGVIELKTDNNGAWEPIASKQITSNIDFNHFSDYESIELDVNIHRI